ncbi:sce7725 family protein [Pseudorhodobacter sp.]|uniref:sce7725 family protein n=1 Tax=Pseudorhodobacter sp. TaxID=1934400 RepID=UPI002AFF6A4B|nr:sce7725 family protein [Pseudorhodobacter sp.]
MYYPYFRGKQFELIAIRDTAELMAGAGFTPIIEPVKAQLKGLQRALDAVCTAGGTVIVVVNPEYGDHADDGEKISTLLRDEYLELENVYAGLLLTETTSLGDAVKLYNNHKEHQPVFIHAGFMDAKALAEKIGDKLEKTRHVFFEQNCKKLYRKHFDGAHRVLLRDGFTKRRNADHLSIPIEVFSDLHITYTDEGMDGFGDFLTVGSEFTEGGGPAYAVAIHLTFIDAAKDDEMYIHHFVSDSKDTPTDPAGKFAEALLKLRITYDTGKSGLFLGKALTQFLELQEKEHFPGLGQAKKLSMIHHIETINNFLH